MTREELLKISQDYQIMGIGYFLSEHPLVVKRLIMALEQAWEDIECKDIRIARLESIIGVHE